MCVRNFGQLGSNSTQDLIALVGELRAGRVPDLAIFLSGVNEVIVAAETGEAGVHGALKAISAKLGKRRFNAKPEALNISRWLPQLNLYRLAGRIAGTARADRKVGRRRSEGGGRMSDTLAQSIVRVWLENHRMVQALGREYGFEYGLFWQPNVVVGRKPLTAEEERIKAGERIAPLVERVTRRLEGAGPPEYRKLYNLVDLFAGDSSLVYLDWHHLTPEGNRRVAEAMVGLLMADRQSATFGHGPAAPRQQSEPDGECANPDIACRNLLLLH